MPVQILRPAPEQKGPDGEPIVPELTEEEKHILTEKKKALDELLRQECIGKYKIELMFSYKRSYTQPTPGVISIWESGNRLHGGGDGKMYFCPGKTRGESNCQAVIPSDNVNFGHLLCPKCGKVWEAKDVVGEIMGRWTMQTWAQKVTELFMELGSNADVYIKQPRGDIRAAAQLEQERQMSGEKLSLTRMGMVKYIYPLARILKDTQNGADLYGRFHAFLKS